MSPKGYHFIVEASGCGPVISQVDRLRELRLDVPPMTRLAHLLQERGIPISSGVLTVDDMVEEVKRLCPSCLSS